jgi:hypothetical protein
MRASTDMDIVMTNAAWRYDPLLFPNELKRKAFMNEPPAFDGASHAQADTSRLLRGSIINSRTGMEI